MYYRRKFLISLIEILGGKLGKTELQKHSFLYSQYNLKSYYDYVPYLYGPYSFTLSYDLGALSIKGLIDNSTFIELDPNISFFNTLNYNDQASLRTYAAEHCNLKGKTLLKKVYQEFPYYALKSKIKNQILSSTDITQLTHTYKSYTSPLLSSIGYEGISIEQYLNFLITNQISAIIDVRKNPVSMKSGFSKKQLSSYLNKLGIQYFHLPNLGIPSEMRADLDMKKKETYTKLFKRYSAEILPKSKNELDEIISIYNKYNRVALTCFEKDPMFCHRSKVLEAIQDYNENVEVKITL